MDAPKNTVNSADEDIIDLTDIIEHGVPQPSTATRAADTDLDAQMDDLFSDGASGATVPGGVESDIDALLSEMDGEALASPTATAPTAPTASAGPTTPNGPAGTSAASGSAGKGRIVDPDEQLEMPGMAEVDSLLKDMDIPPQPDVQKSAPTPPPAEDLDALLTDLLDSADVAGLPASRAVSTPGVEPMEKKAAPLEQDDLIDNLDALFQQNASKVASAVAPAAVAPAAVAPALDDNVSPASSGGDLLDDLDALLGTAPVAAPAEPSVAPAPVASAPAASTPAAPATAGMPDATADDLLDDLDALLGTAPAPVSAVAAPEIPEPPLPVPDVSDMEDLDLLLAAAAPKAPPASPAPSTPVRAAASDADSDMLADLDAILDGTLPPPDAAAMPAARSTDGSGATAAREHTVTPPADIVPGSATASQPAAPTMSFGAQAPHAPEHPAAPELSPDTWRAPLPGAGADASADAFPADALSVKGGDTLSAEELGRAAQELLDEKVMLDAGVSDVDTAAWMHRLDDALDEQPPAPPAGEAAAARISAQDIAPAASAVAVSLEELFKEGSPACAVFAHIVRSAVAAELHPEAVARPEAVASPLVPAASPVSPVPPVSDLAAQLDALTARLPDLDALTARLSDLDALTARLSDLDALTARLSELDALTARLSELDTLTARLAQLEEQCSAEATAQQELRERLATRDTHHQERLAALEARLGSLHAEEQAALAGRLEALEARMAPLEAAVEAASAVPPAESSLSAEDVSQLEQGQVALEDRLTMLEGRLHQSEEAWTRTVEQAAAAAAAKIIREEIAALLAE